MKAIGLTAFGGPEVLRVLDLLVPEAGPGEMAASLATVSGPRNCSRGQRLVTRGSNLSPAA